jgi:membrane associated rhomboid family serine protease
MSDPDPPPKVRIADEEAAKVRVADDEPTIVQKARAAPVTAIIVALNVAVFLWIWRLGGIDRTGAALAYGSVERLHVWAGEYWRIVSYMFLHGGVMHLLMNMYVLVGWGPPLERALGTKRFVLFYFLTGVAAGCTSVIGAHLFPSTHSVNGSVGASGALFGIIGAVMALRRRQLGSFQAFLADKGVRSIALQIGVWTAIGIYALHLDNAAHLGGFVSGFAVCWVMSSPPEKRRNGWLAVGAALAALFVFAARPWWTPTGRDANDLVAIANADLFGNVATPDGPRAWPRDIARGERLLGKGCTSGVASACEALAEHIERMGAPDAPEKSKALKRRASELDPGLDQQMH